MSVLDAGLEKKRGKKTMSENYSNTDLRRIVRAVNKKLRECEDGTDTTTCQLIMEVGYDVNKLSEGDLWIYTKLCSERQRQVISHWTCQPMKVW